MSDCIVYHRGAFHRLTQCNMVSFHRIPEVRPTNIDAVLFDKCCCCLMECIGSSSVQLLLQFTVLSSTF